jgi:hypothetical protein
MPETHGGLDDQRVWVTWNNHDVVSVIVFAQVLFDPDGQGATSGRLTWNVVPAPGLLLASTLPPSTPPTTLRTM